MNARIILATAIIGATALASLVYAGKEGKENQQKNSTEWRLRTVSLGADLKCHGGRS
jgi:hypothetical protein